MTTTDNLRDTLGVLVTLDGLPVQVARDPYRYLHQVQPQSADYALTHSGYALHDDDADIRGGVAYLAARPGQSAPARGWNAYIVATLEATAAIVRQGDTFPDWIAGPEVIIPTMSALISALNYADGHLSNIRHLLDHAARTLAVQAGATADEADAL